MPILDKPITRAELRERYCRFYESMTKAVVDVETGALAIEAEMHADLEKLLLEKGSRQKDLWGCNLLPDEPQEGFIVFTSLINLRPSLGNFSMDIQDAGLQKKVREVVHKWVQDA